MHLLLFLALLAPHMQLPQVQVDPNYNCMMRGTCIATEQSLQAIALLAPPRPVWHEAWRLYRRDCQHRNWRHVWTHPAWCKFQR